MSCDGVRESQPSDTSPSCSDQTKLGDLTGLDCSVAAFNCTHASTVHGFPKGDDEGYLLLVNELGSGSVYCILMDCMIWKMAEPHTTKMKSPSNQGATGYLSSEGFVDFGTFPRFSTFFDAFSLASRILCLLGMLDEEVDPFDREKKSGKTSLSHCAFL
jgi:hypothetical protein